MTVTTVTKDAIEQTGPRAMWSSRMAFILAATGSAVGLGNIWKFPYITGENGGGASSKSVREALEMEDNMQFKVWYALVRYVTPVAVLIVFLYNLA